MITSPLFQRGVLSCSCPNSDGAIYMTTSANGNVFGVIGPSVFGEFTSHPAQRPVMRSFNVFFDLCLNKQLRKQSWGWWSEMPSQSLWCHCNDHLFAIDCAKTRFQFANYNESCLLEWMPFYFTYLFIFFAMFTVQWYFFFVSLTWKSCIYLWAKPSNQNKKCWCLHYEHVNFLVFLTQKSYISPSQGTQ